MNSKQSNLVPRFVLCSVLAITLSQIPTPSSAQDKLKGVEKPFLWKIETKPPSYLFGTIHVTDPRVTQLHPTAKKAFDESHGLFIEVAPEDQLKQMGAMMLPPGKKLEDLISIELIQRLDKQLADIGPGLNHQTMSVAPWAWSLILPSLEVQMKAKNKKILDLVLMENALRQKKKVSGLEDPVEALSGLKQLSIKDQIDFLSATLTTMEASDQDGTAIEEEITEYYLQGNTEKLADFFENEFKSDDSLFSEELADRIIQSLLIDRNKRMAATITKTLKNNPGKSYFFAAGTAHFVLEKTVQSCLKEDGFRVTRVEKVGD